MQGSLEIFTRTKTRQQYATQTGNAHQKIPFKLCMWRFSYLTNYPQTHTISCKWQFDRYLPNEVTWSHAKLEKWHIPPKDKKFNIWRIWHSLLKEKLLHQKHRGALDCLCPIYMTFPAPNLSLSNQRLVDNGAWLQYCATILTSLGLLCVLVSPVNPILNFI